ncbi:MAG: hypothetical protein H6Q33_5176 [Deltaproteobacteria bacterium]|nr:hypothetical protein [Deltaproteobacteria bacterium]
MKLAVAPVTLTCGILSACIAGIGLRLGLSQPAAAIASVIYMVPGLPLINGFVDVVRHKYWFVDSVPRAQPEHLVIFQGQT